VLYARALAIWAAALGPEHPYLAYSLVGLANVALAQHRPRDATPLAQRAVTLREQGGVPPSFVVNGTMAVELEGIAGAQAEPGARGRRAQALDQADPDARARGRSLAAPGTCACACTRLTRGEHWPV
jgi:hypothetical protein